MGKHALTITVATLFATILLFPLLSSTDSSQALSLPLPDGQAGLSVPQIGPKDNVKAKAENLFILNAPMLTILGPDGNEIVLQDGVECETFFFGGTANEFAAVGLDRIDLNIVRAIKAAGNDANLNISADRRKARLKNGQTVYYGAKIKPPARGKVTGVTFVLTTVPTSGVPDIVNNSFNIKYVESVGGRAGDVKSGSTSGKAYQVINPAGDFLYYFSFTAVVNSGGIQTTIVPHYFGGAMVRGITPDRVQCCCAHTKKPLPRVPEITYSCWYGFAHISKWFVSCFRAALAKAVCANTANVPCEGPEATGVEITITGDGFERIKNELTPDRIKITDEQGSVARVTQITEITNTTIKATMDITACRPGIKCVKIEGAGGFTTLTLIKVVQDVPDTIVGQKRFQATRILGTQEKLALTATLSPGTDGTQNVVLADAKYQIYDVTCVTRNSDTTATTTTTGGCNNIATTVVQGTCTPGAGEDNVTVSGQGFTCTAPIRNADINLTADVTEDKETTPGSFLCLGETKPVVLTVSSPSTYSYKVTLSAKTTTGTAPVIQVLDSEGVPIIAGDGTTTLFSGKGTTDITKNLLVKGLSPGTACLTATYYDATCFKCDTIRFTVGEMATLTATSSTGKTVTDNTIDPNIAAPILYLCEDSSGEARFTLKATTNPATPDVQNRVLYQIDGEMATPSFGKIPPAGTSAITLNTTSGNRYFTINAGLDCNGNGNWDSDEPVTRTIKAVVGRMNTLTVTEKANPGNFTIDDSPLGSNPVLQLAWADQVEITVDGAVLPINDNGMLRQAIYKVTTSDGHVIAEGRFDPEFTPTVTLSSQNGSTSFIVTAGLDCNGNNTLDQWEENLGRTVEISMLLDNENKCGLKNLTITSPPDNPEYIIANGKTRDITASVTYTTTGSAAKKLTFKLFKATAIDNADPANSTFSTTSTGGTPKDVAIDKQATDKTATASMTIKGASSADLAGLYKLTAECPADHPVPGEDYTHSVSKTFWILDGNADACGLKDLRLRKPATGSNAIVIPQDGIPDIVYVVPSKTGAVKENVEVSVIYTTTGKATKKATFKLFKATAVDEKDPGKSTFPVTPTGGTPKVVNLVSETIDKEATATAVLQGANLSDVVGLYKVEVECTGGVALPGNAYSHTVTRFFWVRDGAVDRCGLKDLVIKPAIMPVGFIFVTEKNNAVLKDVGVGVTYATTGTTKKTIGFKLFKATKIDDKNPAASPFPKDADQSKTADITSPASDAGAKTTFSLQNADLNKSVGLYKLVAECSGDPAGETPGSGYTHSVEKLFWIVKFDQVKGPTTLLINAPATQVRGKWEFTAIPPKVLPTDFVEWIIYKLDAGKRPAPILSGANLIAEHAFKEAGNHEIVYRQKGAPKGAEEFKKPFTVIKVSLTGTINGPSRHAFSGDPATTGTYELATNPQQEEGFVWKMLLKAPGGNMTEVGSGVGRKVEGFKFNTAGCYTVQFLTGEDILFQKEMLVYKLEIEVAIDIDIDPAKASPVAVPIYKANKKGEGESGYFELPSPISRGHKMRYRLSMTPPIEIVSHNADQSATDANIIVAEKDDKFEPTDAESKFDDKCAGLSTRKKYLNALPEADKHFDQEKKGKVIIMAKDPHTNADFKAGEITMTVPEQQPVRMYVYYVKDSAGHQSALCADAQANGKVWEMLDIVNTYWSQRGVRFMVRNVGDHMDMKQLDVQGDAKNPVLIEGQDLIQNEIRGTYKTPTNLVFVWDVDTSPPVNATGVTSPKSKDNTPLFYSFMDNPTGRDTYSLVLAHEFWHGLTDGGGAHTKGGSGYMSAFPTLSLDDGRISDSEWTAVEKVLGGAKTVGTVYPKLPK